jgi:hypothetical protein
MAIAVKRIRELSLRKGKSSDEIGTNRSYARSKMILVLRASSKAGTKTSMMIPEKHL